MGFLDLTGELLRQIDFEKSEIILPRKLVFVCGGKASNLPLSPSSMRELLLQRAAILGKAGWLGDAEVLLAEAAVNALAKSSFSNLLDLEEFIAAVVHAVLLIVESPGSMCELGAFVKTPEIREKLIVVMPGDFKNAPSFITNGAIKYLEENHSASQVLGFHWKNDSAGVVTASDYTIDEMATAIPRAMNQVHRAHAKETFRKEKKGHLIYLVLTFCHLLRAAKLVDLKNCFDQAGIDVEEKTIKQCIDTLVICKLLKPVEQGKLTYYVALVKRIPLDIAWKKGTKNADRDAMRWITRITKAVEKEESHRTKMFKEYSNG